MSKKPFLILKGYGTFWVYIKPVLSKVLGHHRERQLLYADAELCMLSFYSDQLYQFYHEAFFSLLLIFLDWNVKCDLVCVLEYSQEIVLSGVLWFWLIFESEDQFINYLSPAGCFSEVSSRLPAQLEAVVMGSVMVMILSWDISLTFWSLKPLSPSDPLWLLTWTVSKSETFVLASQRKVDGGRNHFCHWKDLELLSTHGTSFL